MRKTTLLFIAFLLLFTACKKDPTENATLPAATQEGKNTVGFTLNGEVWVPYYECAAFSNPCGEIKVEYGPPSAPDGALNFGFTRFRGAKRSDLNISTGTFGNTISTTGDKTDSIRVSYFDENSSGNTGYYSGPMQGSKFIITKVDFQNQIISGEFELILIEQNASGKTITLKDGRFDFRFNACKCSN